MDDLEYQRMRARFKATGEVDPVLYELILKAARAVVFSGMMPKSLSPTGKWDKEAAEDAAHDWITKRLLNPSNNSLLAAFDHGRTLRKFLSSLELSFQSHLKSAAARTELDNLDKRTGVLLRDDARFREFIHQTRQTNTWWGLAEWGEATPYGGRDADLVAHAWGLGEIPLVRYGAQVKRGSPIVSTKVLGSFLEGLFASANASLTRAHLRRVYEGRFGLSPVTTVPLEDHDLPEPEDEPEFSDDEIQGLADLVITDLTNRQLAALKLRLQNLTLEEIASALGVSRGTADNELKRIANIAAGYSADQEVQRRILEIARDAQS